MFQSECGPSYLTSAKIVFVFHGSELGGAERQGLMLATGLKECYGAEVTVVGLTAHEPGRVARECRELGIVWQAVPFDWPDGLSSRIRSLFGLTQVLKNMRPAVILPYTYLPNVVCSLVWRFAGARLCVWNQRDEGRYLDNGLWHRLAVRLTSVLVSNSDIGKEFIVSTYGLHHEKIAVIPNGVLLGAPLCDRNGWRKKLGVSANCFLVCMAANFHSYKDHATLLKSWRLVLNAVSSGQETPVLCLAGRNDGTESALKDMARELGIENSVRFPGAVDDISGLFAAVDLYVHSSKAEGVPNALLEAMLSGLTAVGSDIPGIRQAMGERGLTCLAPVGDHNKLAELISMFMGDHGQRERLGRLNREHVVQNFSAKKMCASMVTILSRKLNHA